MRDLFVAIVVFGLLPMALRRPQVGIYLWAWIGYHNPHRLAFGWARDFSWAMVIALVTFVGMLFGKEPKRIPWTRETILLLIFVLWMCVTTYFAFYPELAWINFVKVFKVLLMTFVTLMVITNRERLNGLIWVICISLGFYGIKGGLFTISKGGVHRVQGPDGTFFGGNNEMALVLAMTIPLLAYLRLQEKRRWLQLGLGAAMMLSAIAAIGSQSRGGLLGLVAMGTFLWLKSRNKFMTALMILSSVLIIGSIMPQAWYDRMNSIQTYEQDDSSLGRINAWWTAFHVAKGSITGGGFDMFRPATFAKYGPDPNRVHDVHSIYFEIMGEQGFIGFAMFMTLGLMTWMRCNRIMRICKRDPERKWAADLAAMIQVSLIGYATAGAFLGLAYFDLFYHLIAITVLAWTFINQKQATEAVVAAKAVGKNFTRRAAARPG
ncbi:MAG: putative O-glycosylation ligase, exosortase A system-associated [Pseudomonadota bacterium]|nr:putative O-glycosylation ligase, exosortase A system-associated [Pseudomonadota bacterium]MDP1903294.1 putative O-glycosylation ligase, exosortase A system-associated [Pseudomonadota bacterium]MDP2353382.1 putative O-glycosylation ligase, exosortase A system-associated [Pseudomonadota bacterium]